MKLVKETSNLILFTIYESHERTLAKKLQDALVRSLELIFTQIIIVIIVLYTEYLYSLL